MFNRDLWREAKSESFLLGLTISLSAGIGASIVAQAYFLSQIIARVFRSGAHMADLYRPLSTLLAVIALRSLLVFLAEGTARELAIRIKHSLRRRMIRQLHAVGPSFLVTERTGELVNTLGDGVEALDAYFSQYLPQLVIAILTPLIILVAVTTGDLLSAGVLLITAPLIPLFMALVGYGSQRTVQRRWQTLSQMSAHFLDVVQGLTTLKILGQSRAQIAKVARISKQYGEATLGVLRVTFLSALVLELVSTLSIAIVAVEIGLRLLNGTLLFSDALFVLILAPEFYLPLRMLGTRFHAGMNGTAAGRRIFGLFPANRNESTITEDLSVPRGPTCIQFRHVSYAFDGGERPAVRNVSFDIKPGQHLAIVGPSGAGKSTLLHLLLGFISAQEGRILVGDQPLESLDRARWLAQIAWMPEHPHLFHDTVAANIRMGNSQADDSAIVEAARLAGAHEFICALPQGYETNIGEQGVRLSGGQAQRLALARVFLKKASIYIFDEPTANIDSATETIITETIRRLARSQTVITITHRLHTVLGADNAIVLQEGRIVRQGVPARLFAADGYAHVPCNGAGAPPDRRLAMDAVVTPSFPSTGALVPDIGGDGMRSAKQFGHVSRLHTVRRLISLLNGHWHWILVSVLLGALAIGSAIGLLGVSAYLISAASLQPSIADLGVAIVAVRFFGLARGIFRYLERLASHTVTFRLLADLRTWTFAALEPLAPARLSAVGSGDLLARLVSDVTTLENFYVRAVAPPIVAIVVIAGLAGFLFAVHWQLAVAALACLTLGGLFLPWAAHASSRHFAQRLIRARSKSNTLLVDAIQGMADLEAFGYAKTFANRVKQSVSDLARAQRSLGWVAALQEGAAVLVAGVATWLVLFLAIPYVISSQISGVYLATLVLATYAAFEATNPLPQAAQQLASSLEAGGRLFLLGALEPAVKEPQQPASAPERPHLRLRALTFQYEDAKQSALQQVDLDILPGKRMAIVGASGAGKTTLANLLLRFWECQEGQLLLNDQPIQAFAADDVRRLFNVLSQHTYLFNATIRDNIRLSQPEASQEDVIRAARRAQIHEFVTSLPHGYETVIGERGLQLSGGQRQRLALARCLLRPAPILLLDEPTANLDVNTELALLESVHRQSHGRTLIVITHRLVNMTAYDEIVVLDEGKIVERGCHADLLQLNGHYARLWRLQQGVTAPQLAYEKERVSVSHI